MLPSDYNDGLVNDFTVVTQPNLTYAISFDGKICSGKIDGIEAIKQAIILILNTERFEYDIFSWNYGVELKELNGKPKSVFIQAKIQKAICEALLTDDRILKVENFEFKKIKKGLTVSFDVKTIKGDIKTEYTF